MPIENQTQQKVKTNLTVAIGLGVVALAVVAAGFVVFPSVFKSDTSSGGTKSGAKALKVVDVTRAFADVDQFGQFYNLVYKAGSNTVYTQTGRVGETEQPSPVTPQGVLTIERADAVAPSAGNSNIFNDILLLPKPAGAATPFSIGDIPFSGLPSQMVVVQYRGINDTADRYLTVCIGRTDAQKVYVATDGSTYTDGGLRTRTTSEACSSITARTFTPTKITGGSIVAEPGPTEYEQVWRFIRFFIPLADFNRPEGYKTPEVTPSVTLPSDTPLYGGFLFQNATTVQTSPAAMFRIESETDGVAATTTLCFPRLTLDTETGGPLYYFDNQGTAYNDILLKDRAMATSCPGLIAKGYAPESVTKANTAPPLPEIYSIGLANRGAWIGVTTGTLWQTTENESRNVPHPFIAFLAGSNTPMDIPTTRVTVYEGSGAVKALCFAGGTNVTTMGYQLIYYYDKDLRPYRDLFLSDSVSCTLPSAGSGGSGGGTPLKIPSDDATPTL